MTPTSNMEVSEMLERKIKWNTTDDEQLGSSTISRGDDWNAVILEPQRIRVFNLIFSEAISLSTGLDETLE
jgi:hypothetical protein